jgi:hypothetical protein
MWTAYSHRYRCHCLLHQDMGHPRQTASMFLKALLCKEVVAGQGSRALLLQQTGFRISLKRPTLEVFLTLICLQDSLAATLTAEMGKPLNQARNEVRATPLRIQYLVDHAPQVRFPCSTKEHLFEGKRFASPGGWTSPCGMTPDSKLAQQVPLTQFPPFGIVFLIRTCDLHSVQQCEGNRQSQKRHGPFLLFKSFVY